MCKIICKYSKTGYLKYISHLDVLRFIQRSVKRAGIKAKYSEGFNPHMKTSFGYPLSLGIESIGEYFELELNENIEPELFKDKMNSVMPKEMQIIKADYSNDAESLMKRCAYARYLINIEPSIDVNKLNEYFEEMLTEGVIYKRQKINKKNKLVTKELNTKELIDYLKAENIDNKTRIMAVFKTQETGSMKVEEFIKLIIEKGFESDYYTIMKIDALDEEMKPIL
ncbi:MAG TPA: TIGR03936 family radical SAM-associated protein [Sedimentibacter sp.]|jgi:radical SAM-linked protein|nr:TIGR03936 family radical SAM-associated protein [Sedimentibacter sp.]HQK53132.1 TIGR03936 family radical SAM-associated protein [Sedimentibacter sp.]